MITVPTQSPQLPTYREPHIPGFEWTINVTYANRLIGVTKTSKGATVEFGNYHCFLKVSPTTLQKAIGGQIRSQTLAIICNDKSTKDIYATGATVCSQYTGTSTYLRGYAQAQAGSTVLVLSPSKELNWYIVVAACTKKDIKT